MTRDERAAGGCPPASFGGARRRAGIGALGAGPLEVDRAPTNAGAPGQSQDARGLPRAQESAGVSRDWQRRSTRRAPAIRIALPLAAAALALPAAPLAAASDDPPAWTRPRPPLRLIGPITYVGTRGLGAYLIRTSAGAILVDATMAQNVPAIERNIRSLGVRLSDVKLILVSHAHYDHVGGLERMRRDTGARVLAGRGDVAALRAGVPPGETNYGVRRFAPVARVAAVKDGERVTLGDVTLRAVATAGHTPGCTSWVIRVVDHGRPREVVFAGSMTVAGNRLINNRRYPSIVRDYRATFDRMERLRADVVLPMHPEAADVFARARSGTLVAPRLLGDMARAARGDLEQTLRGRTP
ncbi:subclass B3 metallo-beta-lactamase [Sphingomonas sp. RHCKR7]|uniref:subclass B3 metallo-beta-lactamase n=1 Tax=Sphingomonas folli TaxID=2862497 RepID=UPI001CA51FB6|nr:subclass B3 metallo-beta-lactamase [Sphingomonas folli]MBW6526972.1 subclass B3 metallo-beta-lactamase [Sphingomonas folli]